MSDHLAPTLPGPLAASRDERIDALELALCAHPGAIELPVIHRFTPGMYSRELHAPAGVLATTYIHRQEHQFAVLAGEVSVLEGLEGEARRIRAPFVGVTKVGTRRVVFVHEAAVWVTFHPTSATTVEEAEAELFEFRTLPDGTNVRDRFRDALRDREIEAEDREELGG